ncbi:MAG TPA: ADP-ribosylation factor-like protein [Candidatus Bathyarchaeia archaeon]|nr:ADP-ribosylation factor-like protein [Candidatus Bathyarchaeia archaeon]
MFKRQKPPKHILFLGEKNETRDYIIDIIKESVLDPKEKTTKYTFSAEEPDFDNALRSALLKKTDGAIFIVNSADTKDLSKIKEYLWEMFVWNEEARNIPVEILGYNAERDIALTTSEIIEAYSLIRLTDRLWNVMEIHENKKEDINASFKWMDDYIEVLGIKPKILKKKSPPSEGKKIGEKTETKKTEK